MAAHRALRELLLEELGELSLVEQLVGVGVVLVEEQPQPIQLRLAQTAPKVVERLLLLRRRLGRWRARAVLLAVLLLAVWEEALAPLHMRRQGELAILCATDGHGARARVTRSPATPALTHAAEHTQPRPQPRARTHAHTHTRTHAHARKRTCTGSRSGRRCAHALRS